MFGNTNIDSNFDLTDHWTQFVLNSTTISIYIINSKFYYYNYDKRLCLPIRFFNTKWFSSNRRKAIDLFVKNSIINDIEYSYIFSIILELLKFKNNIVEETALTHFYRTHFWQGFQASKLPLTRPWRFLRHYMWCNRAIKQRAPRSSIARAG